jgi:probable addiction module antidote protein
VAKIKTYPHDAAEFIDTPEAQAEYFAAALETDDPAFITDALGVLARARGMTQVAKDSGLGRESLYKALSEGGHPEFETVLRVIRALGLKLTIAA